MLKKKLLNFRPLFYSFVSLCSGIVFSRYILLSNYVYLAIFVAILAFLTTLCIIKKKFKELFVVLISIICGFCFYLIEAKTYDVKVFNDVQNITARVSNSSSENGKYQLVVLDNVEIDSQDLGSNVLIVNPIKNNKFMVGDIVTGSVKLKKLDVFSNGYFSSSNYRNNIRYTASASVSEFETIGEDLHFEEKIQIAVQNKLDKFMTDENSSIGFAMLFGDKSEIDIEIRSNFSESGIAHILAVSGLHVGVLVSAVYFILKKLRCNKYVIPVLIGALLALYCLLCSFSPSVVRASIMAMVLIISNTFSKQYDSLSAIGLAGILILLVRPFSIFDLGFQMSFMSVICIAIFYMTIFKFLIKIKLPKCIATPLAMSICVQIGLFPILINCFGKMSIISIFLNIIIIPVFSFAYIVQFIFLPLSFITNFFGNFLYITQYALEVIKICAEFVANIPYSFITLFGLNFAFYVGYYSTIFVASRMFLLQKRYKTVACLSIMLVFTIFCGMIYLI